VPPLFPPPFLMRPPPQPVPGAAVRESGPQAPRLSPDLLHRLVLLYFALAYGTDRDLHPMERQAIVLLVRRWRPEATLDEAEAVVDAAFAAVRSAPSESPEALAEALAPALTPRMRRRVLADLGRVAKADGWLSLREASLIARVRQLWEEQAGAPDPEQGPEGEEDLEGEEE
jgi:uncharacterized tellurite resistance protein B-like protein